MIPTVNAILASIPIQDNFFFNLFNGAYQNQQQRWLNEFLNMFKNFLNMFKVDFFLTEPLGLVKKFV